MTKKRILVLGSYPINNPQHGGQKRADAIVRSYKRNFTDVRYSAIFYKHYYGDYGHYDISVSRVTADKINKIPDFSDIYCGEAVYSDPVVKRKVKKLIKDFNPDVIHVEQPYVYLGLRLLLKEIKNASKIIFGSQNIEYMMKKDIFEGISIGENDTDWAINKIRELETNFSKECDLLVAVSEEDAAAHAKLGADNIVVAPNGVSVPNKPVLDQFRSSMKKEGPYIVKKSILFIGSAHPPNWLGFEKMVTKKLGFLPVDTRIYIVGGVSEYFIRVISARSIEDVTFWQRAIACGRVSERKLSKLLQDADLIILPITEGGGSNLKTAEAFVANKKIVATSYALRSYDYLLDIPNLYIADTTKDFQQAILTALDTKFIERSDKDIKIISKVLWDNCLKDLISGVAVL
jgi:glycosyltransferase involved in cell wall biosynthesis